jgi:hypothetical protein
MELPVMPTTIKYCVSSDELDYCTWEGFKAVLPNIQGPLIGVLRKTKKTAPVTQSLPGPIKIKTIKNKS